MDTIDLTDSFILADHCALTNIIIDLDTDESLCIDNNQPDETLRICSVSEPTPESPHTSQTAGIRSEKIVKKKIAQRRKTSGKRKNNLPKEEPTKVESGTRSEFGDCPICWEELGKNPLASTICGHVYCLKCLQRYVKINNRCPTCRHYLRGHASFHPLYINKG